MAEDRVRKDASRVVVVHLVGSFDQGGSERQAIQLARLLHQTGRYDVRLACSTKKGTLRREAETTFSEISEYPLTSFYDSNALMQVRRFAGDLRREHVTIVQTHDFYTNVFGMAAAALARVPVRIAARRETGGVRTGAQKVVERCAYKLAHTIVVNADAVGEQLAREGIPRKKIHRVYNSVDLSRSTSLQTASRASILERLGVVSSPERRFVTIIANMRYDVKDHSTFLRAARLVAAAVPDAGFLLAGEGNLLESIKALATDLGIWDRTSFLGRCERIADLLTVSDVCVLSSRAEGFPNAVIEYMAAGKPVVSTDVGGVREALADGETGYLVPPGDPGQMATRIVDLLRDPDRARFMGARAQLVVKQRFSCQAQLSATEALYTRLLSPNGEATSRPASHPT